MFAALVLFLSLSLLSPTLLTAQEWEPSRRLAVVDSRGYTIGPFYPLPKAEINGLKPWRTGLWEVGLVAFSGWGEPIPRIWMAHWSKTSAFWANNGAHYLWDDTHCEGPPMWPDKTSIFVGPPGATVWVYDPSVPPRTITTNNHLGYGSCGTSYWITTSVYTYKPLVNLYERFVPPFRLKGVR